MRPVGAVVAAFPACQNLTDQFIGSLFIFADAMLFFHMAASNHTELKLVFFLEFTDQSPDVIRFSCGNHGGKQAAADQF